MKKKHHTCYMCEAPAVGKEHVPPKCLFPKESQHRNELVSVPSCDLHNSGKSDDDVLLQWVLIALNAHSDIAMSIFNDSLIPLLTDKPYLRELFLPELHVTLDGSGQPQAMVCRLDFKRFENSITSLVRGLYYHHTWYTHKALGPMKIVWDTVKSKQEALNSLSLSEQEYEAFTRPSSEQPSCKLGSNKVFQYDFDFTSDPKRMVCIMRFYEGNAMFVSWDNGIREYRTYFKSLAEYLKNFQEIIIPSPSNISESERVDLTRQLDEQDAPLLNIMRLARHKRDFSAFTLVRLIRADIKKKKAILSDLQQD